MLPALPEAQPKQDSVGQGGGALRARGERASQHVTSMQAKWLEDV